MKVKIDIETRTFVRLVAVLAGFALVGLIIWQLKTPLIILLVSAFLALALNPPVTKLTSYLPKHSRVGATALSYLVVVGVLGGFLVLAVPPAVEQSIAFAQEVPNYISALEERQGPARDFLRQYNLEGQLDSAVENAKEQADEFAQQIASTFVSGVGSLLNGIATILFVLVLTFLMLIEGPKWVQRTWALYTNEKRREHHKVLLHKMYRVVTGYVNGQVLVAAIAALGALVALLVLAALFDTPYSIALPLAGIIFICSMIPMIGATIGTIIVTIVLLFSDITAALIFFAYFVIYQQIENNFVQPIVQSRSVELTALGVLVAVLIGLELLGVLGALLAIPVAGCVRVLVNDFIEHRRKTTQSTGLVHKAKKALKSSA